MNIRARSYSSAACVWSYMILIDSSIMHKIQFVTVLGRQVAANRNCFSVAFLQFRENFQRYTRTGITSRFVINIPISIGGCESNLLVKYVHIFSAQDYVRKFGFRNPGIFAWESRILALESVILLKKTGTPWHPKTKPLSRNPSFSTPGRIVK